MRKTINRNTIGVSALTVCLFSGCAAGDRRAGAEVGFEAPTVAPDVDLSSAGLSLDEVTADIETPSRPDNIRPLTERAASQVARARELVAEQRFTEATIALERALRFDADHPDVHAALASLHWEAGNIERARQHATRALEGNPTIAEAHYILGRCAIFDGQDREAIDALRRSQLTANSAADPVLVARTHFYLAEALAREGYLQAAIDQYRAFDAAVARRDGKAVRRETMVLLEADQRTALAAQASLLERLGRFGEAADVLRPAVESSPEDAEQAVRYAELLIKANRIDEALSALRSLKSGDDAVLDLLSEAHRKSGRPERIIEDLRDRIADQPGEVRFHLRLADELVRLDRFDEAIDGLERFLDQKPDAHNVRLKLVDLSLLQGEWALALKMSAAGLERESAPTEEYESRIRDLADSPAAIAALLDGADVTGRSAPELHLLATWAHAAGRNDQAEVLFAAAVEADPTFPRPRAALGQLYFDSYRYDDVIRVATVEEEEDDDDSVPDDPRLALLLGLTYERLDRLDEAERNLRAVTQRDRANLKAMLALADVYERSGRSNLAQRQLQVLLDRDPMHDGARDRLAVMYMREGNFDAAIEQIAELRRRTDSEITRARCQALLDAELRRTPEIRRQFLLDAIEQHGGDTATWMAVAETYDDFEPQGKYDAYTKAHELDPESEDALWGLVDAMQRMLLFEQAADRFEELLKRRPNRHSWRLALLDLYSAIGRDGKVLAMARRFDDAETLEPAPRRDYRARIIKALRRSGEDDELMAALRAWSDVDPEVTLWNLWLADEYIRTGQADKAVAIYQRRYEANPGDWGALASLADALVKAGRPGRSAQLILGRLGDDPDSDQGIWMLATLLSEADEGRPDTAQAVADSSPSWEAAIELVRNQLLRTRNRETFQDFLVERYFAAGRFDDATALIESLLDVIHSMAQPGPGGVQRAMERVETQERMHLPNEPFTGESLQRRIESLRVQLARALIGDKQYRLAEQRINEWLESARDRTSRFRHLWLLAASQREQGDEGRAFESMRQALELMPDNVSFNNDVAYTMIDQGVNLDEAERMIRFAVWRSPEQPAYLDTYGWLWYKKGLFAEAKKWLERGLALQDQPDPVILDHLGDTLWRLGEEEAAIGYWEQTVELARKRRAERDTEPSADERRAMEEAPLKINAVRSGKTPPVAPLAQPEKENAPADRDVAEGVRS